MVLSISMKKTLIIIGVVLIVLSGLGFFLFGKVFKVKANGAIQIASTPRAEVFLDNQSVGETPYFNDKLTPGEHDLKLAPKDGGNLGSWEGKVKVVANVITSVNRELAESEEYSSGEIISLEKIDNRNSSSLAVVSIPDGSLVKVNGETKGFAPVPLDNLSPTDYQVAVSSPGYQEKTVSVRTVQGYKLTVTLKLAREKMEGVAEATESSKTEEEPETTGTPKPTGTVKPTTTPKTTGTPVPTTTGEEIEKPYVKILSTPTNFLRVRMGPDINATEAARVKPGETYPYLGEEEENWYKIEYETGKEGWVSGAYIKLVE